MYGKTIGETGDLNDATTPGFYVCNGDAANIPTAATYLLQVYKSGQTLFQCATRRDCLMSYTRTYYGDTWSSWVRNYDKGILTDSTVLSSLASALGGVDSRVWTDGSFENMLRQRRQGVYYVDIDYNGTQSDMPFNYCVISVNFTQNATNDIQAQAIAFDIVNGFVKYKCVSILGSGRDYPWRDVPVGLPSFYKDYNSLAELKAALETM